MVVLLLLHQQPQEVAEAVMLGEALRHRHH